MQGDVWLESCEHYQKQSYRNRTRILTSNGVHVLSIPVIHDVTKPFIRDARIEYKTSWQRNHWRAIESAYGNSPYFLYYLDALKPFFEQPFTYLFDYNLKIMETLLKLMRVRTEIHLTEDFEPTAANDLREAIHPRKTKAEDYPFKTQIPYYQVFEDKFGFTPNLSVLDLLFNTGPEASTYLTQLHNLFINC